MVSAAPIPSLSTPPGLSTATGLTAAQNFSPQLQAHETSGSLALAEKEPDIAREPALEAGPQIVPPAVASLSSGITDAVRSAVVQALETGGHSTAAAILDDGQWTLEPGSAKVEVMAKATMIRITFNPAAEKIIRQALTQAGAPSRFLIVPNLNLTASAGAPKARVPQGSIEAEARSHPLVVHAQSLFNAEICSVIDLREK